MVHTNNWRNKSAKSFFDEKTAQIAIVKTKKAPIN
jgi:hypothetical protein